jgi:hypothetical protein
MNNTETQAAAIGSVLRSRTGKTLIKMGSNKGTLWRIGDVSEFFEVIA